MPTVSHNASTLQKPIAPSYLKKINNHLSISLTYLHQDSTASTTQPRRRKSSTSPNDEAIDQVECLISFHNTSTENVTVNPSDDEPQNQNNNGWFGSIWNTETIPPVKDSNNNSPADVSIMLGYLQLFGYVSLNYRYDLHSSPLDSGVSNDHGWWSNKSYYDQYQPDGQTAGDDENETKDEKLNKTPFLRDFYLKDPMVIGGKLAGVNDLIYHKEKVKEENFIDNTNKFLIQDLLFTFNSLEYSKKITNSDEDDNEDNGPHLPLSDITNSIVPFYATSQHLLFTDVSLKPKASKTFRVRFNNIDISMPPSYNTNSTGLVGDQGWTSIRYSLVVGVSENRKGKIIPRSVYFPFDVRGKRIGHEDRWLQPDYLSSTKIDKNWDIKVIDHNITNPQDASLENSSGKDQMLQDLNKLIDSDLHNVSKNERRKSSSALFKLHTTLPEIPMNPQLPEKLKTHYQIRVNDQDLCEVMISKPAYHLGDDFHFSIDISSSYKNTTKIVGLIAHIEAHEVYHIQNKNGDFHDFTNTYRVSPPVKVNSFAASLVNSYSHENSKNSKINGMIHIPPYLCQQFQSSTFMDLKYYVIFKFNLNEFDRHELNEEVTKENRQASNELPRESTNDDPKRINLSPNDPSDTSTTARPSLDDRSLQPSAINGSKSGETIFTSQYRFDNTGSEFKFELPLVVLP